MEIKEFDKLVKAVADKIATKVDQKSTFTTLDKSCLILLPNLGFGIKEYFDYIKRAYPDFKLYLGLDERFTKLKDISNLEGVSLINYDMQDETLLNLINNAKEILVLGLKINQMRDLASANDTEDINHIILGRLMADQNIAIIINVKNLLHNKISDTLDEIKKMGIKVINISCKKESNPIETKETMDLITESYVNDLKKRGVRNLTISDKQLLTPLAKDKLREYKINIKYHEEDKR